MKLKKHIVNHQRTYLILGLWVIISLFNFGKAFHIDDTFHLEAAQHIMDNPSQPMSGEINWGGNTKRISEFNQPPLFFYLIAVFINFFGANEFPLHCLIAVFSLASIYYFDKLLRHFYLKNASYFLIIFSLSPALVANQNVMTDIPLLSLILASAYYYLQKHNRTRNLILSFTLISIALLIKYTALPFLTAIIIGLLLQKDFKYLKYIIIPIATFTIWSIWNYQEFGYIHIINRPQSGINLIRIPEFLCCIGAMLIISPFKKSQNATIYYAILITLLIGGLILSKFSQEYLTLYLQVLFLLNALLILAFSLEKLDYSKDNQAVLILIIVIALSGFIIFFAPFIATRHTLLVTPFILLLIHTKNLAHTNKTKSIAVITTAVMLIGIASADKQYANFYRTQAQEISKIEGNKYTIGYWGWQWYARQNGIKIYDKALSALKVDDLLVIPKDIAKQGIAENITTELIKTISPNKTSINPFCVSNHASLYNSFIDRPVWTFSSQPLDTLCVYKVTGI